MTQLTFQPALDPFHSAFRFLRLRPFVEKYGPLLRDHMRIMDFYLLFPFRIRDIRLAPKHQKYKKLSEKYAHLKPYGTQPDGVDLFQRMEPIQLAAIETLASYSLFDADALTNALVKTTSGILPAELGSRTQELNDAQSDLIEFMALLASEYELSGPNGLKSRTGLLEYRYDAV